MGKRILYWNPQMLVDMLKRQDDRERRWVVSANALPDDAKWVGVEFGYNEQAFGMVLTSETWFGDSRESLPPPEETVFYHHKEEAPHA